MRHYIEPISGDLRIEADESDREFLRECAASETLQSDDTMYEVFEKLTCNSDLQWVNPEELGALTSAPILGTCDETGTNIIDAWWYPGYELRSPQQDLMETGKCTFKKALG